MPASAKMGKRSRRHGTKRRGTRRGAKRGGQGFLSQAAVPLALLAMQQSYGRKGVLDLKRVQRFPGKVLGSRRSSRKGRRMMGGTGGRGYSPAPFDYSPLDRALGAS